MRSATSATALLLALAAILTECHTAQSDRTRQRSGPIRSVPVGADVKRDKDFDCPEEFGYYPHPTDCTLYYVCVFGGALLESCTGGLMYSHELQTCDWPRNVGCDATSPVNEELERYSERDPPPPPPRRTPSPPPPPPPPRAQPNPVVTSRGQPQITISREEYEKQQQLYEEIDDLPPVEEIENDRQQRVYRGQPSTIGQVQRDRDGYTQVNTGRTLNSNIIPASIPQTNSKIGSFSFGTQIDERRQQIVTPAPQTYSVDTTFNALDSTFDKPIDFDSNSIDNIEVTHLRRKRDVSNSVTEPITSTTETTTVSKEMSDRKDFFSMLEDEEDIGEDGGVEEDEDEEEESEGEESSNDEESSDDVERGKRQIRNGKYYYSVDPGLKNHAKYWNNQKLQNSGEIRHFNNRAPQTFQNIRHHSSSNNGLNNHNHHQTTKFPYEFPFDQFSSFELDSHKPFKPSLRDNFAVKQQEPINSATQIITKSPPISSLNNEGNSFTAFASGGFFNNNPKQNKHSSTEQNFHGSSRSPNTKIKLPSSESESNENHEGYKMNPNHDYNNKNNGYEQTKQSDNQYNSDSNESDESVSAETESRRKHNFANYYDKNENNDPYNLAKHEFKFKEVENPFASPDFDFDAFLAKISGNYFTEIKTTTPKPKQLASHSIYNSDLRPSTHSYKGMSTPRPFSVPPGEPINLSSQNGNVQHNINNINRPIKFEEIISKPPKFVQDQQQTVLNEQIYNKYLINNAGRPLESLRPPLQPPNFKDERNLPLNFNFYQDTSAPKPNLYHGVPSSTSKPYYLVTATGNPLSLSTPRQRLVIKPENILAHLAVTGNPYSFSSIRPSDYYSYKSTTQRPLTTIANDHLSVLQNFWGNQSIKAPIYSTRKPLTTTELPNLESLFSIKPSGNRQVSSTPKTPKRIPIPKPSPEMSDYYYDDDEIYYEPPVKSQYMPSSEVRPQRPPMAQNYQEYDDSDEDSSQENGPSSPASRIPANHKPEQPNIQNNVLSINQTPFKATIKDGKLSVPVLVDYNTQSLNILQRPQVANYEIVHPSHRNRTLLRRPIQESGPNTNKPPKYLNQTTLRPYTVRHRLAKPTTVSQTTPKPQVQESTKPSRGRTRHPNIVTEMRITTPRDSHKQETRYTKLRHDGRINSLEPTESVTPATYSANPRPKMLYNGSQTYNPDQYDPYYAVYDEDSELYKDSDFVQQYNSASLRPAVQQTYRGTPPPPPPPPARRPVETYTQRPQATVDYDDALIRGQISNQNQYQSTIRHSTRGEGNELGYDNTLSSVRTTQFEVLSTTPTATSTSTTTTQRPTVAPFTEAMTPSQYSQRSSSDESPGHNIDQTFDKNPTKIPLSFISVTEPSFINISSLAKPFEKTDNKHRLKETYPPVELSLTSSHSSNVPSHTNNINKVPESGNSKDNPNSISLTTGFSIRRNANNTNNPYTLTVISKPFDRFHETNDVNYKKKMRPTKSNVNEENFHRKQYDIGVEGDSKSIRRYDVSSEIITEDESPPIYYVRPSAKLKVVELENDSQNSLSSTSSSPKYILKTVIKRPVPFSLNSNNNIGSKENVIDTETLIEKALQNVNSAKTSSAGHSPQWEEYDEQVTWKQPSISPYRSLDTQRNIYGENKQPVDTTTSPRSPISQNVLSSNKYEVTSTSKPSYYSYRLYDDFAPNPSKEAFSPTAKNILKAFFNNMVSSSKPSLITTTTTESSEEKVVNIGFQKKMLSFLDNKPYKTKDKRVEIITEATVRLRSYLGNEKSNDMASDFSTTTSMPPALPPTSTEFTRSTNGYMSPESTTPVMFNSKFSALMTTQPPPTQNSLKFFKVVSENIRPDNDNNIHDNTINIFDNTTPKGSQTTNTVTTNDNSHDSEIKNLYSTTSTARAIEMTTATKKLSFPTRPSRVNPAIKLAVTNREGGRRSYQSSNKCSDNSLQENPKCNEIQNKRPTAPTRVRGSAHYSTLDSNAPAPQAPNRGTPPNRGSRPTLKPSTAIVSKTTEFVDVYAYPPSRPSAVYPQPTPDKTAAKCRKDVCLLPDCSCGGKDIPGEMPVESVPQMVLLTFDDSVNDLNKGLYADLFEKGRVNPNGCPIASTFYVSHEWTDYSQVQNLYAAGHEMASHTISHSFGEQFSQKKWNREVAGQREILAAYGGVKLEDVRGMRAPFLSVGGNKMFKMLYDSNFTYDSSMPVYENKPPSWPYTLDYKLFHDCMIPPCPTKSYPGVWEVPMVMWQDLNGGRCSMGDACANPQNAEGVYKMILKNFDRHYTTNRAPFGLFYHAAWFTQPHHKEGFIMFLDFINRMDDVWIITNWQALQWVRDPTPINRLNNFQPFQCNYQDRPKKCNNPKVCNLWHKSGVRYMRTCQPCPEIYPWTGKTGIRSSRIDNDIEEN